MIKKAIVSSLCALSMFSCKTRVEYVPVEVKTTITKTIKDTVIQEKLIPQKDSAILPVVAGRDTASHLQNLYAESWARIIDGYLHHTLSTLPGASIDVAVPDVELVEVEREVPVIVEKEKELSSWKKFILKTGPWSILINIAILILMIRKYFKY